MAAPWRASWWRSQQSYTMRHAVSSASTLNSRDRVSPAVVRLLMGGARAGARSIPSPRDIRAARKSYSPACGSEHTNGLAAPGDRPHPRGEHPAPHHLVEHMLTNRDCADTAPITARSSSTTTGPVVGEWEVINTVEEWEAVCAVVSERKQKYRSLARPEVSALRNRSLRALPRQDSRTGQQASQAGSERAETELSVLRRQRWLWRGGPYGGSRRRVRHQSRPG